MTCIFGYDDYSGVMSLEDNRLYIFLGLVAVLSVAEFLLPIYKDRQHLAARWASNFGLSFFSTLLMRIAFPFAAAGFASLVAEQGYGLFNWWHFNDYFALIISVLLLDMAIYWQHVLSHKWPLLWRLHKVHHSDAQMDVSTAVRFHPFEIMFSMLYKFVFILLIGPPYMAVILFEIILSSGALFNHSNIRIPKGLDRLLQLLIVTPNMHRIHHSDERQETDSNYGFSISIWDRVFGSYIANFDADRKINIGLKESNDKPTHNFVWLLKFPFGKK